MTEKEREINRLNNRIQSLQGDINELKRDLRVVRSDISINLIGDKMKRLEKIKERKEFELWKLEREGK